MGTMKMKVGYLPQIKGVLNQLVDKDFSFKRSLEIARFISNQLETEINLVEAQRIKLCKELAKKDDKGEPILKPDNNYDIEDMATFQTKMVELSNVEVELNFNIFSESELEPFEISPRLLIVLGELGFIEGYKKEDTVKQGEDSVTPTPSKNEIKIN